MQEFLDRYALDLNSLLIGGAVGATLIFIFMIGKVIKSEREKARLENLGQTFDQLAQESLKKSTESFLQLAEMRLKQAQSDNTHEIDKKSKAIADLVDPVNKALNAMDEKLRDIEKTRLSAYTELRTQVSSMSENQAKLRAETSSLVQALRSPSARGQWGEMQLKRCLEMSGMVEGIHFNLQVNADGMRPDAVIMLPGGKQVIIDAKAPIDSYLNAFKDDVSDEERGRYLDMHAAHVKNHIKNLGSKNYWEKFDSPEFVIMFLPGESYFSAALERDPALIEAGVEQRVIPASPTTLISLCKAVMYGWSQEKLAESAREISELGQELYKRLSVYGVHMGDIGKGLEKAIGSYNKAIGSLEANVLPQARRFEEYKISQSGKEIPKLDIIETGARSLNAPEFDKNAKESTKKAIS